MNPNNPTFRTKGIDTAKTKLGLQEVRDNAQIRAFLRAQAHNGDIDIDPALTSWCAAFINACERSVDNPGTGKLNAQSFNVYGEEVEEDKAQEGDVIVFHFSSDADWQGHVTYFVRWNDNENTVTCLGGNQHDMVNESNYSQDSIRHIRRFNNETK